MDKTGIIEMVHASAALEGSTLDLEECRLLLEKQVSSAGKTIQEQMMCMGLDGAYRHCLEFARTHEYWSSYRIRMLAVEALRCFGLDGDAVSSESALAKVCSIANGCRLHLGTTSPEDIYRGSLSIHFIVSSQKPWADGNDVMGRLLMNYLQMECGLAPVIVRPSQRSEYKRILAVAKEEDIEEIFVNFMMGHLHDAPEKEKSRPAPVMLAYTSRKPLVQKFSSRQMILQLLRERPYMTTADLASAIGISAKGVEKQLRLLKEAGSLERIGPDKGGHWHVI